MSTEFPIEPINNFELLMRWNKNCKCIGELTVHGHYLSDDPSYYIYSSWPHNDGGTCYTTERVSYNELIALIKGRMTKKDIEQRMIETYGNFH